MSLDDAITRALDEVGEMMLHVWRTPGDGGAVVMLYDGTTFKLEVNERSVFLENEVRIIGFEDVSELRGWLRAHRAFCQKGSV